MACHFSTLPQRMWVPPRGSTIRFYQEDQGWIDATVTASWSDSHLMYVKADDGETYSLYNHRPWYLTGRPTD